MTCRGIRGATSVQTNDAPSILAATRELLKEIVAANDLTVEDLVSVIFTATPDLDAAYPARAARDRAQIEAELDKWFQGSQALFDARHLEVSAPPEEIAAAFRGER